MPAREASIARVGFVAAILPFWLAASHLAWLFGVNALTVVPEVAPLWVTQAGLELFAAAFSLYAIGRYLRPNLLLFVASVALLTALVFPGIVVLDAVTAAVSGRWL